MGIVGFQKRIIAYLIDQLVCYGVATGIYFAVSLNFPTIWPVVNISSLLWVLTLEVLINFVFLTLFTYFTNGRTLGTLICRYKIISLNESRISFKQTILKYCYECFHIAIIINTIYMLVKHRSKTIFDELSETLVVSTSKNYF